MSSTGSHPENRRYDAVIIGGGLAGLTTAVALADAGFTLAVADPAPQDAMLSDAYDGRVTALAYAAGRMYRRLGVWGALEPDAEPIQDILVTDGRRRTRFDAGRVSGFRLHFDGADLDGGGPLGWIVENRHLRRALYDVAAAADNIDLFFKARRTATRTGPAAAEVDLDTGATLTAPLIIGADGRPSPLREDAGIKSIAWRYSQTGIVTTVEHATPHRGVAQEYFLPAGPFAILPITGDRSSLVWTEKTRLAQALAALPDDAFNRQLQDRFGPYLGAVSAVGPRWTYPLSFHLAQRYVAPRLALVGDAAHGVHPIAGQGFNLGLKDIAALTETLQDARRVGLDIGALSVLERYQQWRRFDATALGLGMDALNRLFSNDIAPVRLARDAGMAVAGKIAPLSRFFMRQAGADMGELPALMRG